MTTQREKAERFLQLHHGDQPLLLPNPWDAGSAKVLTVLGFRALATTSGGHAASLGKRDGQATLEEALAHAAAIVSAAQLPVSCDFEHGFADDPAAVAANVRRAAGTGLAGLSVEDSTGRRDDPVYEKSLAVERVAAAAEAAHSGEVRLVLTARAENHIRGRQDLADTIARLQAFQDAGADVLFAPGVIDLDDVRHLVSSVDLPVNVLALPGAPPVAELAAAGVKRVSLGSGLALAALGAATTAARDFLEHGTYDFWEAVGREVETVRGAFRD